MSETVRLVIDIGTNSVLALLAMVRGDQLFILSDRKKTTKLGEGLIATGLLSDQAISRTANAIAEFTTSAKYDEIYLLGTEALRVAKNSDVFARQLRDTIGQELIVLSGLKEAELSFFGSLYDLNINKSDLLLIDVGGGSSEMVTGKDGEMTNAISIPIGALRLKEMSDSDSLANYETLAKSIIADRIREISINESTNLIATGGTISSAATIAAGLTKFDAGRIHGARLTTAQLREIAGKFESADTKNRESLIPFDTQRADIMLPGLGIYLAILGIISKDSLVVSTGGLRFGAALYPDKIRA